MNIDSSVDFGFVKTSTVEHLATELEVVSADESIVRVSTNAGVDADMREAILLRDNIILVARNYVQIIVQFDAPPLATGFDVFIRQNPTEWHVGTLAIPAGDSTDHGVMQRLSDMPSKPASWDGAFDIILRSNPIAAEKNPQIDEIWDGEIIFESVPVKVH